MSVQAKKVAFGWHSAADSSSRTRGYRARRTATSATHLWNQKVDRVLGAVGRAISLDNLELPEEFFPAHLSVAVVNAVFRFRPGRGEQPAPPAERYCHHFGVARRRPDEWALPAADEQESLAHLISHYHELGIAEMASEVFQRHSLFPGTVIARAEHVLNVASALHALGVDTLQDIRARRPTEIGEVLEGLPGVDEECVRMLLTYTGDDDFVWGDEPVRSFVARALGRDTIPAAHAMNLVRESAYSLVLSPRYLDYRIRLSADAAHPSNGEATRVQ